MSQKGEFTFQKQTAERINAILSRAVTTFEDSDSDFSTDSESEYQEEESPKTPIPSLQELSKQSSPILKAWGRFQEKKVAIGKKFVHSPFVRCIVADEALRLLDKKKGSHTPNYRGRRRDSLKLNRVQSAHITDGAWQERESQTFRDDHSACAMSNLEPVLSGRNRSHSTADDTVRSAKTAINIAEIMSSSPALLLDPSTPGLPTLSLGDAANDDDTKATSPFSFLKDLPTVEDSEEDDFPFPYPPQPRRCPDNPVGEEIMYFCDDDEEWYEMIITYYDPRKDEIDAKGKELWEGTEWNLEFKMKKAFGDGHLCWMNAELAVKEEKIEHLEMVFSLIDEGQNGDLSYADFVQGVKIYEEADEPLDLLEEELKAVFCEIHGDCDVEDLDLDDDYYQLEQSDFISACLTYSSDCSAMKKFIQMVRQPNIPERKLIFCKTTDKFVPESQTVKCEDCGCSIWERAARVHSEFPKNYYCPKCYQRHVCNQVRPHKENGRKVINCHRWEIEPRYLEEGLDDEDIFCIECFSRKFAHDIVVPFDKYPLGFNLQADANRPYIKNPSKQLQVMDVVDGSLLRAIDGKRVGHRPPSEVEYILSLLSPPIEITFRSFVPVYHKLQKLKNWFLLAGIAGWSDEQIYRAKMDSDVEDENEEEDQFAEFAEEDLPAEIAPGLISQPSNLSYRLQTFENRKSDPLDLQDIFESETWIDDTMARSPQRMNSPSMNESQFNVVIDEQLTVVEELDNADVLELLLEERGARLVSRVARDAQLSDEFDDGQKKLVEMPVWDADLEDLFSGSCLADVSEPILAFVGVVSDQGSYHALHFNQSEGNIEIIPNIRLHAGYATFEAYINSASVFAIAWAEVNQRLLVKQDVESKQILAFLHPPPSDLIMQHLEGDRRSFWAWDLGDRDTWDACAISKNVLGNSDKSRFSDFTFQTELKGNVWRGTFKKPGGLSMIDSVRMRWVDNENWLGKITGIKKKQTFVEIILNMAQLKLQRMNSPQLPSISELSRSIHSELTTPVLLEQNRSLERRKSDNSSIDSLDGLSRSLADQIPKPPTLRDRESVSTDISTPDEPNDSTLLPAWPTKHSLDGLSQSLADQISKPPTLRDPESLATTQRHPTLRDPESLATNQRPPTLHDQQSVMTDISTADEPNDSTLLPAWLTKDVSNYFELSDPFCHLFASKHFERNF